MADKHSSKQSPRLRPDLNALAAKWPARSERLSRLSLAVLFAVVSVTATIWLSESRYASSAHSGIAASMGLFCVTALIVVLCSILMANWRKQYAEAVSEGERRATMNNMHLTEGMRWVAASPMILTFAYVGWQFYRAWLLTVNPAIVPEIEALIVWYMPYVVLVTAIIMSAGWIRWTLPLFEGAFGHDNYLAWAIFGLTVMYLSLYGVSTVTIGYLQQGSEMFIYVDVFK